MPFRFLFLADTQLGCYASFSGFDEEQVRVYAQMGMNVSVVPKVEGFEWDARQYRHAVEVVNATRPAFVAIGGDMIDDPNREDQTDEFLAITALIDDEIPVRWVPGNHDIAYDFVSPTPESLQEYRAVFGPDHYSFVHGEALFIALNTPVIDHPEHVPGEWERQLGFLEDQLERAVRSAISHVILLGHHPLFLQSADEPDTYWNLPRARRAVLLDLIRRFGVRLGFAGHWHRNGVAAHDGFVQVISGPVGLPLGDDPSGYRVVEVGPSAVSHTYHGLDP